MYNQVLEFKSIEKYKIKIIILLVRSKCNQRKINQEHFKPNKLIFKIEV